MNYKQKLGYTALGAAIMLIGMWLSPLIAPPVTAQHNGVFDEIQCKKLTVVDSKGKKAVELTGGEKWGNAVEVFNEQGNETKYPQTAVVLHSNVFGNGVTVYNEQMERAVSLTSFPSVDAISPEAWGQSKVAVYDQQGKEAVILTGDEKVSNSVVVYNHQGEGVARQQFRNATDKVLNKQWKPAVGLYSMEEANWVSVNNKQEETAVHLSHTEYGGRVDVWGNVGNHNPRAMMDINEHGNGVVATWDKNGNRQ